MDSIFASSNSTVRVARAVVVVGVADRASVFRVCGVRVALRDITVFFDRDDTFFSLVLSDAVRFFTPGRIGDTFFDWFVFCVAREPTVVVREVSTRVEPDVCFPDVLERVDVDVGEWFRFAVYRDVSAPTTAAVWNTDRPRHTVKNSIILFIPQKTC